MNISQNLFSAGTKKATRLSEELALEYGNFTYSPSHLFWSILNEDVGLSPILNKLGVEIDALQKWSLDHVQRYPKSSRFVSSPKPDDDAKKVLQETQKLCIRYGHESITPIDILEALVTPNVGYSEKEIRRLPLALYEIIEWREANNFSASLLANNSTSNVSYANGTTSNDSDIDIGILHKYCDDLKKLALDGYIDPVIGRDREIKQLIEILGKRISPNILVIGEPGTGKTSVVGGLMLKILEGSVPSKLKSATIFSLDVSGQLVAGAFKGEIEERMKSIIKAIKALEDKAILFIDEIHILLDEKGPIGSGVVNLLKPELSKGEITLIGATTQAEFQKFIEKDAAFNRRFSKLVIDEPTELLATEMLKGLASRYEDFHSITIEPQALSTAVSMAKKYIKDKHLPASAIELMDFTMSCAVQMNATSKEVLERLEQEMTDGKLSLKNTFSAMRDQLSELLLGRLEEEDELEENISTTFEKLKTWAAIEKTSINNIDIESITAYKTGIPIGNLRSKEQEKLLNASEILKKRVVGQDHVIEAVVKGLKAFRANLKEPKEPGGIFFFTGSTGTGKTELAKAIAELLFDSEDAMLRFDMSEFQESHSVATLLGAPPGYVGFDAGGILVNNVRKKPYSVVLFDEIEKAHQDIYGIFLQMLTDGRLQDKQGKMADFSNCIVIFTSNAGAEEIVEQFQNGQTPSTEGLKEILRRSKHFKDEFLGRIDSQILPFKPIDEDVARLILNIHYKKFEKILRNRHQVELSISDKLVDDMINRGFSPVYGARPLKNTLKNTLSPPLADKIITKEIEKGDRVNIDVDDNGVLIWEITKPTTL